MGSYTGKVAVITGGGSGLGAAMADRFGCEGAALVLLDIDGPRADAKAAELRAGGADAMAVRVDVAEPGSLAAAAAGVETAFGRCDVLCSNVGVQQFGAIDRLSVNDWQWVMSVNFHGVLQAVAAFLPLLRRVDGRRHVVITSSSSYFQHDQRMAAYVASKFSVTVYAEVLRAELIDEGIDVSILFPAGMMTRHIESSIAARPPALGESHFDQADLEAMLAGSKVNPADVLGSCASGRFSAARPGPIFVRAAPGGAAPSSLPRRSEGQPHRHAFPATDNKYCASLAG